MLNNLMHILYVPEITLAILAVACLMYGLFSKNNSFWKNGDNTLSSTDKSRLKNIAKKLHDLGFESFYSYYE